MPFLTIDEAFLRAADADPQLNRESFLDQVRGHIGRGSLLASGFKFWVKKIRLFAPITLASPDLICSDPVAYKNASRERVEIPPLAMADYSGPGYDSRIVRDAGADIDGWAEVRLRADDVERLWPRDAPNPGGTGASKRGPYESGERAKIALKKCFPNNITPSKVEMSDSEIVRRVQAKHDELFKDKPTPDRKTIITHAGRLTRN